MHTHAHTCKQGHDHDAASLTHAHTCKQGHDHDAASQAVEAQYLEDMYHSISRVPLVTLNDPKATLKERFEVSHT
jgi:hypothetical protein